MMDELCPPPHLMFTDHLITGAARVENERYMKLLNICHSKDPTVNEIVNSVNDMDTSDEGDPEVCGVINE